MIPFSCRFSGHVEVLNKMNVMMYQKKHKATVTDDNTAANIDYKSLWTARRSHIMRGPSGGFHTHDFRVVMSFLFNYFPARSVFTHFIRLWLDFTQNITRNTKFTGFSILALKVPYLFQLLLIKLTNRTGAKKLTLISTYAGSYGPF